MGVAVADGLPAAEPGLTAIDDPSIGLELMNSGGKQAWNSQCVLGRINITRKQIRRPKMLATEDIERQMAIVVVISMIEAPILHAADAIICPNQQSAAVGSDGLAAKQGLHFSFPAPWKFDGFCATLRLGGLFFGLYSRLLKYNKK